MAVSIHIFHFGVFKKPSDSLGATLNPDEMNRCKKKQSIPPLNSQSLPEISSPLGETRSALFIFVGVLLVSVERSTCYCLGLFHAMYFFSTIRIVSGTGFIVTFEDTMETPPMSSNSPMLCIGAVTSRFPLHTNSAFLPLAASGSSPFHSSCLWPGRASAVSYIWSCHPAFSQGAQGVLCRGPEQQLR